MIIGIGHDITDIRRIEKMLARFEDRFAERCFTRQECDLAESRAHNEGQRAATYAKRFAAKEACAKALGSGIAEGVILRDIEVVTDRSGRPSIKLHGVAYQTLQDKLPDDSRAVIHLSLSDEPPYASAYVVIEACQIHSASIMMETQ